MSAAIRLFGWTLALTLIALPLVGLLNGWFAAERWPIRQLRLSAEFTHVTSEQVHSAVAAHAGQGFFALSLEEIRTALSALPWVERVEVRKRWPDTLDITLYEHRAVARWGRERLLSEHGVVFSVPDAADVADIQRLPLLDGPDSRVRDVVAVYADARKALAATGLTPIGVHLTRRGSWRVMLPDGADLVVGRGDPLPRLARFARVLPKVWGGERRSFARADLRYPNGFAITWQPALPAGAGTTRAAPENPRT
jgi:cell division protein FtsQ